MSTPDTLERPRGQRPRPRIALTARHQAVHQPIRCECYGAFTRRKLDGAWLLNNSRRRYVQHIAPMLASVANRHTLPGSGPPLALTCTPAELLALLTAGGPLPGVLGAKP